MIVQCQQCSTKFRLDDGRVTEAGVKVRCSKCRHVFVVRKEAPEEEFVEETVTEPVAAAPPEEPAAPFAAPAAEPEPDFGFSDIEEPPPGLVAGTDDIHFGEPAEEETKPYFEVNYPPPQEDDFDFSDFELKIDEEPPAEDTPSAAETFHFGELAAEPTEKPDFEILPREEAEDFSITAPALAVEEEPPATAFAAPSSSTEPAPDTVIDFGVVAAGEPDEDEAGKTSATEPVIAAPDKEEDLASSDELPPFVMSRRQSSSFFPVVVTALAVVFVLVMAGAGVFFLKEGPEGFDRFGLGFIPKWFGAEPREEGKISLRKIEGAFVKNAEAGEVFVIRGEAVNEYKKARASIQVKGIVYGKNGAQVASKTIYCGNSISTELIGALPMSKLETTMNNQFGDSLSNLGVPPGKSIPFVIVIANVPQDASDYGVEVAGSTVASQQ